MDFFILVCCFKKILVLDFSTFNISFHHPVASRKKTTNDLCLKEVAFASFSVFLDIGTGTIPHIVDVTRKV